jgi:hypothetical protein
MGNPGAPTKYKPEYCQEMLDYFDIEPYRTVTKKVMTKKGELLEIEEDEANDFPNFAGFAVKIKVTPETLLNWSKTHDNFKEVYSLCKACQENYLSVNGNKGLINTAFGIFTAKNVTKWRDRLPEEKDDININVNNDLNVSKQDILERIDQLKQKDE